LARIEDLAERPIRHEPAKQALQGVANLAVRVA
jgi:hypothetical protein